MRSANTLKNSSFSALKKIINSKEQWLYAILLWRIPCSFEMQLGIRWPHFKSYGLPKGGAAIFNVFSVSVDQTKWWLLLCGLATLKLTFTQEDNQKICNAHVFVGRLETVEKLHLDVVMKIRWALEDFGYQLENLTCAFEQSYQVLFSPSRFVRSSQLSRLISEHEIFASVIVMTNIWSNHPLQVPDKTRTNIEKRICSAQVFLNDPYSFREAHNAKFIENQALIHAPYFATVESSPLTEEQIHASLHFDDANVTVAAAGSGKTSVMVSKVGYALQSGLLQDHEVIVLAFNKAAALELRDRINGSLVKVTGHKVKVEARTFHSLGLALWLKQQKMQGRPTRPRLIDFAKSGGDCEDSDALKGKRLLRTLLIEMANNPVSRSFSEAVMNWAAMHRYQVPELEPCDYQTLQERQSRYEWMCKRIASCKDGALIPTFDPNVSVRSIDHALLVNWLYLRNVSFEYRKCAPIWLRDKINSGLKLEEQLKVYRPDFTYPNFKNDKKNFFHEHFEIDKCGEAPEFMGRPYEERAQYKRTVLTSALSSKNAEPSRFIETSSAQLLDDNIFNHLETQLRLRSIPVYPLDPIRWDAALKSLLEDESIIDLVAKFVVTFKDSGLTIEEVQERFQQLNGTNRLRAKSFLQWMRPFLARLDEEMTQRAGDLGSRPLLDFSSMIGGAVAALKSWPQGTLPYKLVLVDEFQDISRLRAQLVQGLLNQNPAESMLYCVGDDWQSINRFAGSDLGIFRDVYIGTREKPQSLMKSPIIPRWSSQSLLNKTFRCPQGIADVARWFVMKGGAERDLIDKLVTSNRVNKTAVMRVVEHGDSGAERFACLELQLNRIVGQRLKDGSSKEMAKVFILTRNKKGTSLPKGIQGDELKLLADKFFSYGLDICHCSMHGSKGLGGEYVILVGMDSGKGGFPGDFMNEPLIDALLPARRNLIDEERRLFYVAMTRAKVEVTMLCVGIRPSPFVIELEKYPEKGVIVFENILGLIRYQCPHCAQGWVKSAKFVGKVECTRTPFCGFVGQEKQYPELPSNP